MKYPVRWQEREGDAFVWRFGYTEYRPAGVYVAVDREGEDDVVFVPKDAIVLQPVYPQSEAHTYLKKILDAPIVQNH